jgi:nitroimidazol reductase NimA-like FMN-containing flavoprotein (pyridoxamine 5'-phosphate oxidase superfamily)
MLIHEMTKDECRIALESVSIGTMACARDGQPYVVPTYFSYDGNHIYGVSMLGQKIEWMRANPLVCLQIWDRKNHYQWLSVVVSGRYEELISSREFESERVHAHALLQKRAMWWQPGLVATEHRAGLMPIYYRMHIVGITGRRAMPDKVEAAALVTE